MNKSMKSFRNLSKKIIKAFYSSVEITCNYTFPLAPSTFHQQPSPDGTSPKF